MKKFIAFLAIIFTSFCFAQDTITTSQVTTYLGKEAVVKGIITSFKLAAEGKSTNFINIDKAYPDNVFTVVVTNQYLQDHNINLTNAKGKKIIVKGTISTYDKDPKKIPQIFNPTTFEIK